MAFEKLFCTIVETYMICSNIPGPARSISPLCGSVYCVKKSREQQKEWKLFKHSFSYCTFLVPGRTHFKMHLQAKFMSGERTHSQFPNAIWNEKFKDVAEVVCDLLWSFFSLLSLASPFCAFLPPPTRLSPLFYFESIDFPQSKMKNHVWPINLNNLPIHKISIFILRTHKLRVYELVTFVFDQIVFVLVIRGWMELNWNVICRRFSVIFFILYWTISVVCWR